MNKIKQYHSTFTNFDKFQISGEAFGIHVGSKESALNRLRVKKAEMEILTGEARFKDLTKPILMELEVSYQKAIRLEEGERGGTWSALDVVRRIMEKADEGKNVGFEIEPDVLDLYLEEESLFMPEGSGSEYEGEDFNEMFSERMRNEFLTDWLKHNGVDAIIYHNEFEKGGDSIILVDEKQINIVNKIHLTPEFKPLTATSPKMKM
ncbi:hypothetical protein QTV49_000297 [Vibrio vulnificus]|nr:hypothetical protein [Vibrio vulnificus]